jgi:tetratricopeptide (TPR) repeat protein
MKQVRMHTLLGLVLVFGGLPAVYAADEMGEKGRAETRQAISELVGELQRRENEVVQARAKQEAMAVELERLKDALAEARGTGVSGANMAHRLAVATAAAKELASVRKSLAESERAREAACSERDAARAEAEQIKIQMDAELAAQKQLLVQREAELATLVEQNRRDRVTLSYNLGCLYKASQRYAKAEEQFRKALVLDPDDPEIHYNLGVLYDDCLMQPDRARIHYSRFLELSPDDEDAARVVEWLSQIQ